LNYSISGVTLLKMVVKLSPREMMEVFIN